MNREKFKVTKKAYRYTRVLVGAVAIVASTTVTKGHSMDCPLNPSSVVNPDVTKIYLKDSRGNFNKDHLAVLEGENDNNSRNEVVSYTVENLCEAGNQALSQRENKEDANTLITKEKLISIVNEVRDQLNFSALLREEDYKTNEGFGQEPKLKCNFWFKLEHKTRTVEKTDGVTNTYGDNHENGTHDRNENLKANKRSYCGVLKWPPTGNDIPRQGYYVTLLFEDIQHHQPRIVWEKAHGQEYYTCSAMPTHLGSNPYPNQKNMDLYSSKPTTPDGKLLP